MALKCRKCGGDVSSNQAKCPNCGLPARSPLLTNVVQVVVIFFIIPGLFIMWRNKSHDEAISAAREARQVELRTLLSEYTDNEVRADAAFKGKVIQTSGVVDDVKRDVLNTVYVVVGTGKRYEARYLQCFLDEEKTKTVASLTKGSRVTIRGRVKGLMMNVLVEDCELVEL